MKGSRFLELRVCSGSSPLRTLFKSGGTGPYSTPAQQSTALAGYVTPAQQTAALKSYLTTTAAAATYLTSTAASTAYVTPAQQTAALAGYVTPAQQTAALAPFLTTTAAAAAYLTPSMLQAEFGAPPVTTNADGTTTPDTSGVVTMFVYNALLARVTVLEAQTTFLDSRIPPPSPPSPLPFALACSLNTFAYSVDNGPFILVQTTLLGAFNFLALQFLVNSPLYGSLNISICTGTTVSLKNALFFSSLGTVSINCTIITSPPSCLQQDGTHGYGYSSLVTVATGAAIFTGITFQNGKNQYGVGGAINQFGGGLVTAISCRFTRNTAANVRLAFASAFDYRCFNCSLIIGWSCIYKWTHDVHSHFDGLRQLQYCICAYQPVFQ